MGKVIRWESVVGCSPGLPVWVATTAKSWISLWFADSIASFSRRLGRFLNGDRRVPVEPVYDQTVFQLLHPALHSIRASALASSIGIGWRLISKC